MKLRDRLRLFSPAPRMVFGALVPSVLPMLERVPRAEGLEKIFGHEPGRGAAVTITLPDVRTGDDHVLPC